MEIKKAKKQVKALTDFTISVQNSQLLKKDLKSKYPKWKLWIARLIDVELADSYDYCYRIKYKSSTKKIKVNDVLLNSQGRAFVVLKELNRIAVIVTPKPSVKEPFIHGTFRILNKPKK